MEPMKMRHSFCTPQSSHPVASDKYCKSDIDVLPRKTRQLSRNKEKIQLLNDSLGQYYKKYEHDEVPVKDLTLQSYTNVGDKGSLTNSELDKLEMKIFKNMSQELQTDNNSVASLESNIKFFKTTVQEIFDNFYASIRDFEAYKKRFHEILAKNQEEAVADMEDFIKDMIQHIMSSDSSLSNESRKGCTKSDSSNRTDDFSSVDAKDGDTYAKNQVNLEETITLETANTNSGTESVQPFVEAYKNEDYYTDSTMEDMKAYKGVSPKEEVFNIYLLSGNPCVQIKMNDRNLLSEINIKEPSNSMGDSKYVASAENMRRLADKKMELEKYVEQEQNYYDGPDIEIPVKVSYAKKNIHLNEDFTHDRESEKSFIAKICSFLCRKFRKS